MASVAQAVMESLPAGVTARMVDYWIRCGWVDLDHRTFKGSGHYRWLHADERAWLHEFGVRYLAWRAEGDRFRSGAVWADIVNGSSDDVHAV